MPFKVVPMVVTDVQDVIASGQVRPTDQLMDAAAFAVPARSPPSWSRSSRAASTACRRGAAASPTPTPRNHDALQDPEIGAFHAFVLHAIDATGLVHAAILRMQALILPVRTLVLSGGH